MEDALHRFVQLLRLRGVRLSVPEMIDGMRAVALPGVLADHDALRDAPAVTLIKDRRDMPAFEVVFDRFFTLRRVVDHDDFFKPEDMAQQYNLHQEANRLNVPALTDVSLSVRFTLHHRARAGHDSDGDEHAVSASAVTGPVGGLPARAGEGGGR